MIDLFKSLGKVFIKSFYFQFILAALWAVRCGRDGRCPRSRVARRGFLWSPARFRSRRALPIRAAASIPGRVLPSGVCSKSNVCYLVFRRTAVRLYDTVGQEGVVSLCLTTSICLQ